MLQFIALILKHYSHCQLFQAQKETLTCILNCMAHMATIPEEVESAFLHRTIKAVTWVRKPIHLMTTLIQQLLSFPCDFILGCFCTDGY